MSKEDSLLTHSKTPNNEIEEYVNGDLCLYGVSKKKHWLIVSIVMHIYYRALDGGNMKYVTINTYDKYTKKKENRMKLWFWECLI